MKILLSFFATLVMFASLKADDCAWCQTLSLDQGDSIKPAELRFSWSQGEAETNKVDLLFAFDSSARNWLADNGWTQETFSNEVLMEMNSGIALTRLDEYFTFRLVALYDLDTNLAALKFTQLHNYASGNVKQEYYEQYFAPLRQLRENVAADIVVVITIPRDTSYYGLSRGLTLDVLTNNRIVQYADYAYCIVDARAALDRFAILHEVGHLFGAGHSNTQKKNPGPQLFNYSSGYNFYAGGTEFVTVMGYQVLDSNGNLKNIYLPCFSSPDYLLDNVPVGTEKNDNTRTLLETYAIVANFRVATPIPGYNPSNGKNLDDITLTILLNSDGFPVSDGTTIRIDQFENIEFSVSAKNPASEKTTVKVTGLPMGMKYSSKTGKISGYPKKTGTYSVTVKARAKGKAAAVRKFTLSVAAIPDAVIGSYAGIVSSSATGDVLATTTLSKTGRVTVKMRYDGSNRTFSCNGFDGVDNGVWSASAVAKIKKVAHTLDVSFDKDGRSISIAGFSGCLLQNAWGRRDISAPVFRKAVQGSAGGFTVRLYGKGKVRLSGEIGGVSVGGTFQLVAGTPEDGYSRGKWSLPVAFAAKRNFAGWSGWLDVDLTVDSSNRVTGATVEAPGNL